MKAAGRLVSAGLAVVCALSLWAQEATGPGRLQVVKYPGLAEVIQKNRGKVVLVDFWAEFCAPCKRGFPHVVALHEKYAKDGLVVVSVSLDPIDDPASPQAAAKFLKQAGAEFTNLYLLEPVNFWQKKLGFEGVPCYFVFGRQGQWTKFANLESEGQGELDKCIVERLREK